MRKGLILLVADLLADPGGTRQLTFDELVPAIELQMSRVPEERRLHFGLTLEAIDSESVRVKGKIAGTYDAICGRCLTELEAPFEVSVSEIYRPEKDVLDEGYVVVDGETIDLEPAIRDSVLLVLPVNPTCTPDCRGLCPVCGKNRNEGECGCQRSDADSRWLPLKELLDRP